MKKTIIWLVVIALATTMALLGMSCKAAAPAETTAAASETTAAATTAAATTAAETTAAATTAAGKVYKIGFACKILSNPWFVYEFNGMKQYAQQVGNVEMIGLDSNLDEEKLLSQIDELIAQKCDAIITSITSATIGPAIAEKCASAKIPLIAIDDAFKDKDGNFVPYVGLPNYEIGVQGGQGLSKLAIQREFFKEGNKVELIGTCSPKAPVQMERVAGFKAAMFDNTPATEANYLFAATDTGMMNEALTSVSATVSAHPDVTHWIAFGLNDDSGVGALKAFEELGVKNYIACGVGGYDLALEELSKGNKNYITVGGYSQIEGYKAVEEIYKFLTEATPLEANIFVAGKVLDLNNYQESSYYKDWAAAKK